MDFDIHDLALDALCALSAVAPFPDTGIAGILLPGTPLLRDVCTFEFGTMSINDSIAVEFEVHGTGTNPEILPDIAMTSLPSLNQLNNLFQRALAVHHEVKHSNVTFTYVAGIDGDMPVKLPTWTLLYWALKYQLVCSQTIWSEALASLRVFHPDLSQSLSATIVNLSWNHPLPNQFTHAGAETIQCLSRYCHANDWLNGHHMDQMISLIREDLVGRGITDVEVSLTEFFESLVAMYRRRNEKKEGVSKRSPCQKYGENLSIGATSKHIILVNIKLNSDGSIVIPEPKNGIFGNHWMTVVVDGYREQIGFADPLGFGIAVEVEACFQWWLAHFFSKPFAVEVISGSNQEDTSSCGLHSISTAHHHANPDIPLLTADKASRYRVEWLGIILNKLVQIPEGPGQLVNMNIDPELLNTHGDETSISVRSSASKPSGSKPPTKPPTKPSGSKPPTKPSRSKAPTKPSASKTATEEPTAYERMMNGKKNDGAKAGTKGSPLNEEEVVGDGRKAGVKGKRRGKRRAVDFDNEADDPFDFVDTARPKLPGGRALDPLMERFTTWSHKRCEPENEGWRCIGEGCRDFHKTRTRPRVLKHATECLRLSDDLQLAAHLEYIEIAPSSAIVRIQARQLQLQTEVDAIKKKTPLLQEPPQKRPKLDSLPSSRVDEDAMDSSPPIVPVTSLTRWIGESTKNKKELRHAELDQLMVILRTSGGLPGKFFSKWEFRDAIYKLDPKYPLPTRDKMDYILIPGEREVIVKQQNKHLSQQWNLTGSHDGGTSRCKQAFWLQHISDADRNVFLVQAVDATGESHTAVWIADFVDRTVEKIGPEHFAGLVCDSTGNTLGSRTIMSSRHRIILTFPDACHHISSQIKDIVKLPYFAGVITIIRATLTFFHKSHAGIYAFAQARKDLKISRALDAIGKTRFATIIYTARSIQRNLLAFQRIFRRTNLNFEYQEEFEPMLRNDETGAPNLAAIEFQSKLGQLISIGMPGARVIACLESNYATPGDFYLLWHAMVGGTLDVVQSSSQNSRFPIEVQEKVRAIVHHRHQQVFSKSGNLYTPAYLAAAYLNPANIHSGGGIFKIDDVPVSESDADLYRGIKCRALYKQMFEYLGQLIQDEIETGGKPEFLIWRGRATACVEAFKKEMALYARGRYPYEHSIDESSCFGVIDWWRRIAGTDGALLLPYIAIKLYSIRVNSMPEERTVSKFTSMSAGDRHGLHLSTMAREVQVAQFYKNDHEIRMKTFQPEIRKAPVRYTSIQAQFEKVPTHSGDSDLAIEPPPHDEEDDKWLDAELEPEVIPSLPSGEFQLDTHAVLSHSRIVAVLSKAMEKKVESTSEEVAEATARMVDTTNSAPPDNVFNFSLS